MNDNWQSLGTITSKLLDRLKPVTYEVPLDQALSSALDAYARHAGKKPETIIAEAVRSYMGDAA